MVKSAIQLFGVILDASLLSSLLGGLFAMLIASVSPEFIKKPLWRYPRSQRRALRLFGRDDLGAFPRGRRQRIRLWTFGLNEDPQSLDQSGQGLVSRSNALLNNRMDRDSGEF